LTNSKESPAWNLQIPFVTSPELAIAESRNVAIGDYQAQLMPGAFGYARLRVGGIASDQTARELFELIRIGLLAASLSMSWGIRVQDDVTVLADGAKPPRDPAKPFVFKDGHDLSGLYIKENPVQMSLDKSMPLMAAGFEFGVQSSTARNAIGIDRVKLALELYVESYFEISDSAQFVGLVNVLEVLKDTDAMSDTAQVLVAEWRKEAGEKLSRTEADSIQGSLGHLMQISISRGIRSAVTRHLGEARAKEVPRIYEARSTLVHAGNRPANIGNLVNETRRLVRIC
jgi:hypothetical protein